MNEDEIKQQIEIWMPDLEGDRFLLLLCQEIERKTRQKFFQSIQKAINQADARVDVYQDLTDAENRRIMQSSPACQPYSE
jgi:hypothetical protein